MKVSLGLLEVKGLALAINTADAMAKCAAITIVDIETCKGGGWQTIKVTGDVAAVQAAVTTGAALAQKFNGLVAQKVLSRPDRKVLASLTARPKPIEIQEVPLEVPFKEEPLQGQTPEDTETQEDSVKGQTPESESIEGQAPESDQEKKVTCNLCGDPGCPRKKGEPHTLCINEGKQK